jgi:predicted extracellular nuclease
MNIIQDIYNTAGTNKKLLKNRLAKGSFFILCLSLFISFTSCSPWRNAARKNMTVVFYNVENLFDLDDEPGKQDDEFTTGGARNWNVIKYYRKLEGLSNVISAINEGDMPEIVGLCEVENEKVVRDLIFTNPLALGKYDFIHNDSPDIQGLDCAMIYRPDEFRVTDNFPIPVRVENDPDLRIRDILYIKGYTRNREEFHIFVNHWPSDTGEVKRTEYARLAYVGILKEKIDSVKAVSQDAHIVIMGDMNVEPDDTGIAKILNAGDPEEIDRDLVNLMIPENSAGKGSYNHKGELKMFDNLIVSAGLFDDKGFRCTEGQGYVFHHDWMEYKNNYGRIIPLPTFKGMEYLGGASDHFPVYFRLRR